MKALAHDWVWGATSHRTRDGECRCGVEVHDETPNTPRRTVSYRTVNREVVKKPPPCTRLEDDEEMRKEHQEEIGLAFLNGHREHY